MTLQEQLKELMNCEEFNLNELTTLLSGGVVDRWSDDPPMEYREVYEGFKLEKNQLWTATRWDNEEYSQEDWEYYE